MTTDNHEKQEYKDFLRLILEHKSRIYGYILRLIPNRAVADDLMQETTLVMWEKFAQYELGTNFAAWGIQIARIKILQYRSAAKKCPIHFSQDVFNVLAQPAAEPQPWQKAEKIRALESCLRKLSRRDHKLIQLRYTEKQKIKNIAGDLGWTPGRTYKLMAKIHYLLKECIEKYLSVSRPAE